MKRKIEIFFTSVVILFPNLACLCYFSVLICGFRFGAEVPYFYKLFAQIYAMPFEINKEQDSAIENMFINILLWTILIVFSHMILFEWVIKPLYKIALNSRNKKN